MAAPRRGRGLPCCAALITVLVVAGCGSGAIGDFEPTVYEAESRPSDDARLSAALPKSVLQAARTAASRGQAGVAESLYRRAVALDPDNPAIYTELARLFLQRDAVDEAAEIYRAAIRLDNKSADALYGLGRAQILLDQPREAATSFSAANAVAPSVRGYNGLGVARDMTGAHGSAQAAYVRGLELDPENLGLRNNLGLSQILSGRHDEAVATLRQAASHPLATPRERQNLALALGLSENPGLAARVGRLDLTEDQVADNLVLYKRLRDGPDRATLTALRRDRGGLVIADTAQMAESTARPAESASIIPLRGAPSSAPRPSQPAEATPPPPAVRPLDHGQRLAPGSSLPQHRARSRVPEQNPIAAKAAQQNGAQTFGTNPGAPTRDPRPNVSTKDVAVPMQVGEPGVRRGRSMAASPNPARETSIWSTLGDRSNSVKSVALSAEILPDAMPTFVASNAPAGALPMPGDTPGGSYAPAAWFDEFDIRSLGWITGLALLFAGLIAIHMIVSRQIRISARAGAPGPTAGSSVGQAQDAPAAAQGSICGNAEVALINAILSGDGPLIEQAQRCRRLMEDFGYSATVLAQLLGKSPGQIASMARLVGWQERVSKFVSVEDNAPREPDRPPVPPLPQPAS